MIGLNKVILVGNLGKDPEVFTFPQDIHREGDMANLVKKATFTLATTEVRKNRDGERVEQTDWHNIVCWRGLADIAEKKLHKGAQLYVEGKLQSRSWEDKEGNRRYITEVVAENFTILNNRQRNDNVAQSTTDPYANILTNETEPMGDLPF